jgi:hypothetical protein
MPRANGLKQIKRGVLQPYQSLGEKRSLLGRQGCFVAI